MWLTRGMLAQARAAGQPGSTLAGAALPEP